MTTTATVSSMAFIWGLVFSPAAILMLKAVGLPVIIKYVLDWDFIQTAKLPTFLKKEGMPEKVDLVEAMPVILRPFTAAAVSLILYVAYSLTVQDPFNADTFARVMVDVGITGGASVWANNIVKNIPTKDKK